MSDSSRRAVSIRIGTSRLTRPLRTARHSDRPSSPGSITSSTSRSNARRLGALRARPGRRPRRRTRSLRGRRCRQTSSRIFGSSSTTSTRGRTVGHQFFHSSVHAAFTPGPVQSTRRRRQHDCNVKRIVLAAVAAADRGRRRRRGAYVHAQDQNTESGAARRLAAAGRDPAAAADLADRAGRWACCRCSGRGSDLTDARRIRSRRSPTRTRTSGRRSPTAAATAHRRSRTPITADTVDEALIRQRQRGRRGGGRRHGGRARARARGGVPDPHARSEDTAEGACRRR